jgi:uncharacterized protein (TIGR03435 family)
MIGKRALSNPSFSQKLWSVALGLLTLAVPNLVGQQNALPASSVHPGDTAVTPQPVYDVASIKKYVHDGGSFSSFMRINPDGIIATHMSVRSLICNAYGVSFYQLSGGPAWVDSDLYDVNVKMDDSSMEALAKLPPDQLQPMRQKMLQAVLAERFKLEIHHETKQFPVYALVVAKGGSKLHPSAPVPASPDEDKEAPARKQQGNMMMSWESGGFLITAQSVGLVQLAGQLGGNLNSKVENKTGLDGRYDFTLRFASDDLSNSASNLPSIFDAVQEQLGLKLESTKGPMDVIVIDRIDRPSEN